MIFSQARMTPKQRPTRQPFEKTKRIKRKSASRPNDDRKRRDCPKNLDGKDHYRDPINIIADKYPPSMAPAIQSKPNAKAISAPNAAKTPREIALSPKTSRKVFFRKTLTSSGRKTIPLIKTLAPTNKIPQKTIQVE